MDTTCELETTTNNNNVNTATTTSTTIAKESQNKDNASIKQKTSKSIKSAKSKKSRQKSAQNLSNEMENYIYSNPRTTAYRAASYRPTLERFQSIEFADCVRAVLLGVHVDGVEPEDPYY